MQRPELAEGAGRVAEGAVDENEQRPAVAAPAPRRACWPLPLSGSSAIGREPIDAGIDLAVDLLRHRVGDDLCDRVLDEIGDDLDAVEDRRAPPGDVASARGRGRVEAAPAEPGSGPSTARRRRRLEASPRAPGSPPTTCARMRSCARFGMKVQRRAVRDVQHDDVVAGASDDRHRRRPALRAHAHRRLDRSLHFRGRQSRTPAQPLRTGFRLAGTRNAISLAEATIGPSPILNEFPKSFVLLVYTCRYPYEYDYFS